MILGETALLIMALSNLCWFLPRSKSPLGKRITDQDVKGLQGA